MEQFLMRAKRRLLPWLLCLVHGIAMAIEAPTDQPTLRWMTIDFPPLFMVSGPEHGVGDYAQGVAVANLPGYEHVLQAVPPNYQRIEQEMKNRENVCFAGFLKTPERERFMTFSEPYLLMLPVQLFISAGHAALAQENGAVDLRGLLDTGTFRLGVLGGRRYGATLDQVIDSYGERGPVYRRYSKDQLRGLINMLMAHDRAIDGVLAYPGEITYLSKQESSVPRPLRAYPLQGSPAAIFGYFACSRSRLGQAVIASIDRTIPHIRAEVAALYARDLAPPARAAYASLVYAQWGIRLPRE
ncbi:TIGR02285 family protein [Pseudomonas massiliensis]|uniref:TIGR02285 family protein n=1 Tax=Pseudomonas massiliensis TaxID=522492 RepID=UPI0012F7A993|nr:TIGR02285 family protein [Pseudomonas massiliensis]